MIEIEEIKERNKRVELDKAWELSWTRRISIAAITYVVATIWLNVIGVPNAPLNALVPTGGYLLSTLSLTVMRNYWVRKYSNTLK